MSVKIDSSDPHMRDIYLEIINNMMVDGEDDLLKELELEILKLERYADVGDDVLIPEMIRDITVVERNPVKHDEILKDCSKMRKSMYYFFARCNQDSSWMLFR
jgi:hypothetical protein